MLDGAMKSGLVPEGSGAWKTQRVPRWCRQMLQWQRWTGRGRDVTGMLILKCTALQWHCAVRIFVAVDILVKRLAMGVFWRMRGWTMTGSLICLLSGDLVFESSLAPGDISSCISCPHLSGVWYIFSVVIELVTGPKVFSVYVTKP
jgi:hypothetical protein